MAFSFQVVTGPGIIEVEVPSAFAVVRVVGLKELPFSMTSHRAYIVDDLFAYKVGVVEDFYFSCVKQPCDDLENGDLDVYEPRRCYDEYERMFAEAVILIDNRLVKLIDITLEQWLDLKFRDHKKVDKEIMEELSDLEEENLCEGNEIAEVFRIETDIFLFETPLCKEFKEFNHLLQIDVDVLIGDLLGFKTGHVEWSTCNWKDDGYCNGGDLPGVIQVGNMVYFQDYEWYKGLEDGDLKDEALKEKATLKGSWGHDNRKGKKFFSWLKESFGNYDELDYELMLKLKEYWWGKKEEDESSEDAWRNNLPNDEIMKGKYDNDAIQEIKNGLMIMIQWKDNDDDEDIGDLD
ncbi:hypothetical protein Tco_0790648 [Tanacetum coccineum]